MISPMMMEVVKTAHANCTGKCKHAEAIHEVLGLLLDSALKFEESEAISPLAYEISIASQAFHMGYRMAQLEHQQELASQVAPAGVN